MPLQSIFSPIGLVILILFACLISFMFKEWKKGNIQFKNFKVSLYAFLISIIFPFYYIIVVGTYYGWNSYQSEEIFHFEGNIIIAYLMTITILILYIVYIMRKFKQIKFLCTIIYPLIIFNIYIAIMYIIAAYGFSGWIVIFTIFIPIILGFIALIIGLIKDISYLKNKNNVTV